MYNPSLHPFSMGLCTLLLLYAIMPCFGPYTRILPLVSMLFRTYILTFPHILNEPCTIMHTWYLIIFHRYPYARGQRLLVDLFERAGKMYYECNRRHEFVLHILHLNVPQLFAIEYCGQQCNEEDKEVVTKFCSILVKYGTMDTQYFLRKQLDDVLVWFTYYIYYLLWFYVWKYASIIESEFKLTFFGAQSSLTVSESVDWMMLTCQYPLTLKCVRS